MNVFSPISANTYQSGSAIVDEYRALTTRLKDHETGDPVDVSIDGRERSGTCYPAHARARTPLDTPGEHRIDVDQMIPSELFHGISGMDVGQFPEGTWLARAGFYQVHYTEVGGTIRKEVVEQALLKKDTGAVHTTYVVDSNNPTTLQQF